MTRSIADERRPATGAASLFLVRHALGVTRADLSGRTGIPATALSLFEEGWVDLWEDDKLDVARVLGVPATVLWGPSLGVLAAWLERPQATA